MDEDLTRIGLMDEEDILLDQAALVLALADHPDTDPEPYEELLDGIATRLDAIGHDAETSHARADALAHVLSGEFGFAGDDVTYDDPANADLVRVIDRRRGLPVSLSILWVAAARRLGWTANILDLPGHVLVLIGEDAAPVIVDPFRGGAAMNREQLAAMLAARDPSPAPVRHVAAMPNRAILIRLLLNQSSRAEQAGDTLRALMLHTRMTAIAPAHVPSWWDRARLELLHGDLAAARASLTAILEITRDADVRARVVETLDAVVSS